MCERICFSLEKVLRYDDEVKLFVAFIKGNEKREIIYAGGKQIEINCEPDTDVLYAGGSGDIFTPGAEKEIYKVSSGIPRMINRICEKSLMYSAQNKKKLIDEHVVRYVAEHEMVGGGKR